MKILVVGATGGTGRQLLKQALAQGYEVAALVRKPRRVKTKHAALRVIKGDVLDQHSIDPAMKGQQAVICALGKWPTRKPTTLFWEGTANLIRAMNNHGVCRLICVTGLGAGDSRGHGSFFYERIALPLLLKNIYEDKDRQEELVRNTELDWIIVRPARLTNGPLTGNYLILTDLTHITAKRISRADVADFCLKQLTSNFYLQQTPLLTY
jgi:putative NADH-flavin reductase